MPERRLQINLRHPSTGAKTLNHGDGSVESVVGCSVKLFRDGIVDGLTTSRREIVNQSDLPILALRNHRHWSAHKVHEWTSAERAELGIIADVLPDTLKPLPGKS